MEPFFDNWQKQLRRGLIELYVLNELRDGRLYGYDIVRRLRDVDGMVISEGTVYPILSRLHREGLVETALEESSEGPARKYYRLSTRGASVLKQMNAHWRRIVQGINGAQEEVQGDGPTD